MGKKIKVRLTEQELIDLITKQITGSDSMDILKGILSKASTSPKTNGETPEKTSGSPTVKSSGSVESKWNNVTKKVIDEFEGGYWNYWQCKNHPYAAMYRNSGETLFGLDRKAGNIENLSAEGKEFFKIIDDEKKKLGMSNFCKKWTYNYRGGELEERLKALASKIMFSEYAKNMSNYVKDPETKKRIENNEGLLLHMSYATWNGPGNFNKFAKKIDTAVKEGKSDDELIEIAKNSRTSTFGGDWAKATAKVNSLIDKASSSGLA
jgi:hypothetical protein